MLARRVNTAHTHTHTHAHTMMIERGQAQPLAKSSAQRNRADGRAVLSFCPFAEVHRSTPTPRPSRPKTYYHQPAYQGPFCCCCCGCFFLVFVFQGSNAVSSDKALF